MSSWEVRRAGALEVASALRDAAVETGVMPEYLLAVLFEIEDASENITQIQDALSRHECHSGAELSGTRPLR
jgi:hypothetical protein